jgi:hypothetical protein
MNLCTTLSIHEDDIVQTFVISDNTVEVLVNWQGPNNPSAKVRMTISHLVKIMEETTAQLTERNNINIQHLRTLQGQPA